MKTVNYIAVYVLALASTATFADTHYVSSGQSIQAAINGAVNGDEIEVAPGTYYEAINFNGKAIRLYSTNGPNDTTIDGTGLSSSVVKCMSREGTDTVLSGFTITGGTGSLSAFNEICGGGMFVDYYSHPTVTDCIFRGNSAYRGAGMYNHRWSNPTVIDCTFVDNASSNAGGGMYNHIDSNPKVTNCTFSGNSANFWGAGMYNDISADATLDNCRFINNTNSQPGGGLANYSSWPTLTNCTFTGNTASDGGGMYNLQGSSPTVENCTFDDNTAVHNGGGMYNCEATSPTVENCAFSDNAAGNNGGGMYNASCNVSVTDCTFSGNAASTRGGGMASDDLTTSTVANCTFTGNTSQAGGGMYNGSATLDVTRCIFTGNAAPYGGGMWNYTASPAVTDCIFSGNTSTSRGSGMYNEDDSDPAVTNCTFTFNTGTYNGGGMWNRLLSDPTATNCIFWGNGSGGGQIYSVEDSTADVTYSDVQGAYTGTGNIDADPLFVDADGPDDVAGTEDDDLRLLFGSPCIDSGDPGTVTDPEALDIDGCPRVTGGRIDMGACEYQTTTPVHRFWKPADGTHFYTVEESEKDKLINDYPHVYTYEGPVYHAFAEGQQPAEARPVYRFWKPAGGTHFYTMKDSEADKLINDYPHIYTFEGPVFYAYAEGDQPAETQPVHRFWKEQGNTHFYTINESEKNKLIDSYSHVYTHEGAVWYAYE